MHRLKTELRTKHALRQLARRCAAALLLLLGVAAVAPAQAQETQAQETQAQETSAGDGLEGLLEGLDLQLPSETPTPPESSAPHQSSAPRQQTQGSALRNNRPVDASAATPLLEAYRSMQAAQTLLAQGETGEATRAAQQRAVDLLDQMIEAAQQQSASAGSGAPQSESPQQSSSAEQPQPPPGEAGEGDNAEQRPGEESGEGADSEAEGSATGGPGQPAGQQSASVPAAGQGAAPAIRSEGAGASVWGHLPERTRGMLRSEMPTEYLPQYASEISEYFRQLAEMKPDE